MDGTLYRFHDHIVDESGHVQIEKMYEPDFFIKLDPFENMKDAINLLYSVDKEEVEIFVLSSADIKEVVEQKNYCLDRDFPFIDEEHRLFPKTWESKTEKIPEGIRVGDILIDDYNVNLEQWKDKGGASIKFVNNINHQGKGRYGGDVGNLWEHEILRYDMKPKDIVLNLEEIIGIQRDRFLFRFPDEEKNQRYAELKERYELVTEEIPIEKTPTIEYKTNEVVDNIIKNMGVGYEEKGDRAYYSPANDTITLPPMTTFHSEYGYYATKLHESCHATGHPSRLNRDIENSFGSQKYAIEELRAEIGSSFLMAELGLEADENHVNNHKAYIQSWISELKNDPKVLFDAIKDADEIVDYIKDIEDFEKYISLSEIEQETLDTIEEDKDELEMEM